MPALERKKKFPVKHKMFSLREKKNAKRDVATEGRVEKCCRRQSSLRHISGLKYKSEIRQERRRVKKV